MGRLVVVSGTGTGIGKTHVSEAVLVALGALLPRVAGVKPVESGVEEGGLSDARRLSHASTFHVKHTGLALREPVSPHRAARLEGIDVDVGSLAADLSAAVQAVDVLLAELPGGLFTPLSNAHLNAHFAALLRPDLLLLVAPDRLGVLHDVLATTRAADAMRLGIRGVVLVTPAHPDASTGTNAAELARFSVPVLSTVRRASVSELAYDPAIAALVQIILDVARPCSSSIT
jgi:dethiobiotin synthetase